MLYSGNWPSSSRTLHNRIDRKGEFWSNVTYSYRVDLSGYDVPGVTSVKFTFVDPLFKWIHSCNSLLDDGITLQWDPKQLFPSDGDVEAYGAGIEYGLLLRSATATIPESGKVALMNISWDGGCTGFGSRSAVPILIQVMNTNSSSTKAAALIGYLPYIEVAPGYTDKKLVQAKSFLLQVC